tara:strand:+ start:707 stop:2092 length:1386 start_codon:yes stop_codon:yes gene_type:complete
MAGPENGGGNTGAGFGTTNQRITQAVIDSLQGMTVDNALIQIRQYMTQSTFQEFFIVQVGIESISQLVNIIGAYNASLSEVDDENGDVVEFNPSVYKTFVRENDISEVDRTVISSGLFANGAGSLSAYFSSSTANKATASYIEHYAADPASDSSAQVQFAVGYAHIDGSGSLGNTTKTTGGNRETAALYRQFRNVILGPDSTYFQVADGSTSGLNKKDFIFVVFNRSQMREKVDPGNWELHISGSGNSQSGLKLIDDSSATSTTTVNRAGRVFNIVSGSIASGTAVIKTAASAETATGAPGLFYPDLGILILNTTWITGNGGLNLGAATGSGDKFGQAAASASLMMSSPSSVHRGGSTAAPRFAPYFAVRREEEISSRSFFCRATNKEFNFSANPTYETKSDGTNERGFFTQPTFQGDPKAYITQVGLYDNNLDLMAVAKLSQPQLKSYSREALIKVKLDF